MLETSIDSRQALWQELAELIGPECVSRQADDLDFHGYDVWPAAAKWKLQGKHPTRPEVVVRPVNNAQVSQVLAWASRRGVAVTPWGLGSSVTGAPLPLHGGISLDLSGLRKILAFDEHNLMVKVQAGLLGIELERELNQRGYTLNHSPQSLDRSSVGGWVSTRAMGQFSSRYGGIEDLVVAFSVILADGSQAATTFAPRAAVGPDLRHIWMGAEGTLGVVVDVTLKIFPQAARRIYEAVAFERVESGVEVMRQIMRQGLKPFLVRFYDPDEAHHAMKDRSFSDCAMFLGFEGLPAVAEAEYQAGMEICRQHGGRLLGPQAVEAWMERRFDFSAVENLLAQPGGLAETVEIAHFWDGILETYWALKAALAPYAAEVLGHFSHVYPQGSSLYIILLGSAPDDATAEQRIYEIWETAMRICLEKGAAISHHHGVGMARLPYIESALDSQVSVLKRIKEALDPGYILNPGKLAMRPPQD